MKIGILTYHCVPNFGAQLQALSTIGFLRRIGHIPVLLHWYPKDLEQLYARHVSKEQISCQMNFSTVYYPQSVLCRNEKQLIKEIEQNRLDMIVTGSDALFKYVPKIDRKRSFSRRQLRFIYNYISCEDLKENPFFCDYYGALTRQIPVVAFSVSSQSCPYYKMTQVECNLMRQCLANFKQITVRDSWTKQMVEYVMGINDIKITPDPVFSFNKNNYLEIPAKKVLSEKYKLPNRYALITFSRGIVENDYIRQICILLLREGITPVAFPEPEGLVDFGLTNKIELPLNPMDWYALLIHSEGYIGTRMHPIIVCLHNSVPFFSFDGNGTKDAVTGCFNQKSSKVYDVLEKAGFKHQTYALNSGLPLPCAKAVIDSVISFDKTKCSYFAHQMASLYEREMFALIEENK